MVVDFAATNVLDIAVSIYHDELFCHRLDGVIDRAGRSTGAWFASIGTVGL